MRGAIVFRGSQSAVVTPDGTMTARQAVDQTGEFDPATHTILVNGVADTGAPLQGGDEVDVNPLKTGGATE
jgi:hypothetical protein